jgi:signal recognition particle GTPase
VRVLNVKSILNSEERIILHLSSYKEQKKKYDLPLAVTRKGIAKATGMGLSHASRQITNLKKKDHLITVRGRAKGKNRNQDFYFLNLDGIKHAQNLIKKLKKTKIRIIGLKGSPEITGFYSVMDHLKSTNFRDATLTELCKFTNEEGVLDVRNLTKEKKKKYVDSTFGAPKVIHFFGRVDEVSKLHNWIAEKDKHNIIFIHGMAGIGKTTLAAKLLEDYRSSKHLFWYEFHEMDTFRGVLFKLAGFLTDL